MLVIDASVALKWLIPEADSDAAASLLSDELIAPSLWLAEAANVLRRHVRLQHITPDRPWGRLAELARAPVMSLPIELISPPLYGMRSSCDIRSTTASTWLLHGTIYTQVITADRRFVGAALSAYPGRVRLLGAEGIAPPRLK